MRVGRWLVATTCATALTVALTGCAAQPIEAGNFDGGDPASIRGEPATPAAKDGIRQVVPVMPSAASAHSDAGVQAFVQHYVALFNYGRAARDWKPLLARSSPTCETCQAFTKARAGGGYESGGEWRAARIVVLYERDPAIAAAEVEMRAAPGRWVPSPGAAPTPTKNESWTYYVSLARKGNSWITNQIGVIEH